ncbi:hypothetical protein Tco_0604028 [Tanacetum coccineum]
MDSRTSKIKLLLMEAKGKNVLDAEGETFLADVECTALMNNLQARIQQTCIKPIMMIAYDSDVDGSPKAGCRFHANLSSTSANQYPRDAQDEHLDLRCWTEN